MGRLSVATHCPYCALQCGMQVSAGPHGLTVAGDPAFPTNRGSLCIKGWTAPETLDHADRLRTPFVRDSSGALVPASWDEALDVIVRRFTELQTRYGPDALGVFGGGALTNEKA